MTHEGEPGMPRGTWRYRVVRQTHDDETLYGIHEAYDGGTSWTARPVAPVAETVDELRDVLAKMATAPEHPVITDTTPAAVNMPVIGPPVICAYCLDEFGPDELVDGDIAEVVCTMCAKAGRTVRGAGTPEARREELARLLHDTIRGRITPDDTDPIDYADLAQAVLDWTQRGHR